MLTSLALLGALLGAVLPPGVPAPPGRWSPAAPPGPARLHWAPCPGVAAGLDCAALRVPLDYARPGGRHITIALSEVPASAPSGLRQGVLVVNPGGPGGSGRALAATVAGELPPSIASEYTIVGFDPRGVGASVPSMHCDPSYFRPVQPSYTPATRTAELALEAKARGYAQACERRYGWLLPYMSTVDTARDVESIATAMGQARISYFGFSYGTYIGQVYATLYPASVRRMVLDSTVDTTGVWYADNLAQDVAAQRRLGTMFAWAARYDGTYHLGSTGGEVAASFATAKARLTLHPVAGRLGPDELDDDFVAGLYTTSVWPDLAAALSSYLRRGSSSSLVALYRTVGAQDENEFAVYNAVECSDVAWPRNWARWDSDTRKLARVAPLVTWDNTWFNAACAFWPVKGPAKPFEVGAPGLPGILMVQGSADAATPYAGAQRAHALLPSARMVVVEGDGNHGEFLSAPPGGCVAGYVYRYLASGRLPTGTGTVNARCPADRPPVPFG